jgi:Flp pilus assembly protein TadB
LVSLLCRWCQVREDLIYAIGKCKSAGLADPVGQALADLDTRVKGGMPIEQALDLMQGAVQQEQFSDLVTAIRFNFRYRGDLPALLEHLEWQLNKIEEEYDRRRISNSRDRQLTLAILLIVPFFLLGRLAASAEVRNILLGQTAGILLFGIGVLCYLAAVAGFCLVQKHISG